MLKNYKIPFEEVYYDANGCFAPVLLFVFTISKGPCILKLKVRSALVSFVKIIF